MSTSVGAAPAITAETPPSTPALLSAMLRAATKVSDLIFSPGRPPIVEQDGRLLAVRVQGLPSLTADHTQRIAADLIGNNKHALDILREQGACDISYGLPGNARFRVNVFMQRGSCAIVMRVIPGTIPNFAALRCFCRSQDCNSGRVSESGNRRGPTQRTGIGESLAEAFRKKESEEVRV